MNELLLTPADVSADVREVNIFITAPDILPVMPTRLPDWNKVYRGNPPWDIKLLPAGLRNAGEEL